jgi:hypothetical protein
LKHLGYEQTHIPDFPMETRKLTLEVQIPKLWKQLERMQKSKDCIQDNLKNSLSMEATPAAAVSPAPTTLFGCPLKLQPLTGQLKLQPDLRPSIHVSHLQDTNCAITRSQFILDMLTTRLEQGPNLQEVNLKWMVACPHRIFSIATCRICKFCTFQ